jgi:DNA-binding CsgD family transcriptional regulator
MATIASVRAHTSELAGRRRELDVLDRLIEDVRAGESRTLLLRGEAGVGKTALLEHLVEQAADFRVTRAAGVQAEMELAFAGLHQLLAPMLGAIDDLPGPQGDALRTAFGLSVGRAPDGFFIGVAVLGLLANAAEERPLLCVVDDEHWLDRASAQALGFVARRLQAESVALVFGARTSSEYLAGLPELELEGLNEADAHALLNSLFTAPIDPRVCDQIVAETRGIPLALIELLREVTPAELAGGFGLLAGIRASGSVEDTFRRRVEALPADTRRLILLAAADSVGDPSLILRAAERLGISAEAALPAAEAALLEVGTRVRFRHPLVRSATYRLASAEQRQEAHRALAQVTDPEVDPDRRAWHWANAASGPDEEIAAELERSADRAKARGGLAAAAAFLERAVELTLEPSSRPWRAFNAAQAKYLAGAPDAALALLATTDAAPLDELPRARADLLRAQIAFASRRGSDAPQAFLGAARRLAALDVGLARQTYIDALSAATFAGRLASPGGSVADVASAARAAPRTQGQPLATDLLLDGLAINFTDGYAAAVPVLRRALEAFGKTMSAEDELRRIWLANISALHIWDDEGSTELAARHVRLARELGAVSELPLALTSRVYMHLRSGELAAAAALLEEIHASVEATGSTLAPYAALGLAALRGAEADIAALIEHNREAVEARGEGIGITAMHWARALLHNGLGRYHTARAAAEQATSYGHDMGTSLWALAELVEAATRSEAPEAAIDAHRRLVAVTQPSGTDWALGLEARAHALLQEGPAAERLYLEAIDRLSRTRARVDVARAQLLYGEWLRRKHRRVDARNQLRAAHESFVSMGTDAFANRAARELLATGETVRTRNVETRDELTAQETQIARLARDGLSNPEIGERLFISPRTVQYHLRKVFAKLKINSRNELDRVLHD